MGVSIERNSHTHVSTGRSIPYIPHRRDSSVTDDQALTEGFGAADTHYARNP